MVSVGCEKHEQAMGIDRSPDHSSDPILARTCCTFDDMKCWSHKGPNISIWGSTSREWWESQATPEKYRLSKSEEAHILLSLPAMHHLAARLFPGPIGRKSWCRCPTWKPPGVKNPPRWYPEIAGEWMLIPMWLVVWNNFFHNIWDNPSRWLILLKMVIAPPTSYYTVIGFDPQPYVMVIWPPLTTGYGDFLKWGLPPNHPAVMDDHETVLKPMVTWGFPICHSNTTSNHGDNQRFTRLTNHWWQVCALSEMSVGPQSPL